MEIHVWSGNRTLCGEPGDHPKGCQDFSRWPDTFGWPPIDKCIPRCPTCLRTPCLLCLGLSRPEWFRPSATFSPFRPARSEAVQEIRKAVSV